MTNATRNLIKNGAPASALISDLATIEEHKKDLKKRLNGQKKGLVKTIEKGWDGRATIEQSIAEIEKALEVANEM